MTKNIEAMTDHELLVELVSEKRQNDRIRQIKLAGVLIVLCVILILCAIYVPKAVRYVCELNERIQQAQNAVERVESGMMTAGQTIEGFVDGSREYFAGLGEESKEYFDNLGRQSEDLYDTPKTEGQEKMGAVVEAIQESIRSIPESIQLPWP